MFDTPSKIFENAERLSQIGLNVPQITQVCDRLRAAGMPLAEGIYTIEDAAWQISKLLKGGSAE